MESSPSVSPSSEASIEPAASQEVEPVTREYEDALGRKAVGIDWEADGYTRLHSMGELLSKEKEAEDWIERYKRKAAMTRSKLRHVIGEGEIATAFICHAGGLYVYAGHHFGHSLYEGVGFEPPPAVRSLMADNRYTKWRRSEPEQLGEYEGDRVFMALPDRAVEADKKLLEHPAWRELRAVRTGHSYITSDKWANYNPVTLFRHLDQFAVCLLRRRRTSR